MRVKWRAPARFRYRDLKEAAGDERLNPDWTNWQSKCLLGIQSGSYIARGSCFDVSDLRHREMFMQGAGVTSEKAR